MATDKYIKQTMEVFGVDEIEARFIAALQRGKIEGDVEVVKENKKVDDDG